MASDDLRVKLCELRRDELNAVAKRLRVKNYRLGTKEALIDLLLSTKSSDQIRQVLFPSFWSRYHNHIYGMASLIGLVIAILPFAISYLSLPRAKGNQNSAPAQANDAVIPGKFVILVADFKGPNNENYGVTELIIERLRDVSNRYADIEVKALGETISAQNGSDLAIVKGKDHGASVVLWGWFAKTPDKVLITSHFVTISGLPNSISVDSQDFDKKQIDIVRLPELENFSIQTRLSDEMAAITLFATGLTRQTAGDDEAAISLFTDALGQRALPDQIVDASDIYLARGIARLNGSTTHRAETSKEALADFNKVILAHNRNSYAYLMRAHTYSVEEKYRVAITDVQTVLGYETNIDVLANAYDLLGNLYYLNDQHEQAKHFFDKFLQLTEGSSVNANFYSKRAEVFSHRQEYDKAIENIDIALQSADTDKDRKYFHYTKGIIRLDQEHFDEAIQEFDEVLSLDPRYIYAYYLRGNAYFNKKDYGRAIENYDVCLSLGSQFANAYVDRGEAYYAQGNKDKALQDYQKAIESNSRTAKVRALYDSAEVYLDADMSDNAVSNLSQCLALEPSHIAGLKMRAYLYGLKGKYDASISDYDRIIKLEPNDAKSIHNRGDIYHVKGLIGKALEDYSRAIALNPNFARAYADRGMIYIRRHERTRAISDLQMVLQLTSDPRLREKVEQQLLQLGAG